MFFSSDPFGHFGHGGGGRSHRAKDTTKLYETLGLTMSSSAKEIKKAYHKLALIHHPDKGGDEHTFREISAAYEILADDEKRAKYDKYGLDGLEDGGGGGGKRGPEDLFNIFFSLFEKSSNVKETGF